MILFICQELLGIFTISHELCRPAVWPSNQCLALNGQTQVSNNHYTLKVYAIVTLLLETHCRDHKHEGHRQACYFSSCNVRIRIHLMKKYCSKISSKQH